MSVPEGSIRCNPEVDRISQLPDNVIDKILTSLPIVEAAKTAVLSRNWKLKWNSISGLVFDYPFFSKFDRAGRSNFMLAVCETLMLHSGPIDEFSFIVPWPESCPEMSTIIQVLSRKKVKRLAIDFKNDYYVTLPSYLFSCLQLRTLCLQGCVLSPPRRFGGFSQLITLFLTYVEITNDFFEMFIPNCLLLQNLMMQNCSFREVCSFKVTTPNLRSFYYQGWKPLIRFTSAPLLDYLEFYDFDYECEGDKRLNLDGVKKFYLDGFCSAVPALRKLKVDYYFLKSLVVDDLSGESSQASSCLRQLNDLCAYDVWFADKDDVSSLLGLIRSSPNLERLSVWMYNYTVATSNPFKKLRPDLYDFYCNRLQSVEFVRFNGTDPEMEFVKFVLSKSPQLKTATIHPKNGMDDKEQLKILKKLIRFQCVSAAVDVNFKDAELAEGSS